MAVGSMAAIDPSLLFQQSAQPHAGPSTSTRQYGSPSRNNVGNSMDLADGEDVKPRNLAGTSHSYTVGKPGEGSAQSRELLDESETQTGHIEDEHGANNEDDATLAGFLTKLDDYEPVLPDAVTRYYLERAGFQCADDRVTRLLGLAAQKFVSDIASDAYAYARARTTNGPGRAPGAGNASAQAGNTSKQRDRTRTTLTQEDLAAALSEYGIDAARAPYYR